MTLWNAQKGSAQCHSANEIMKSFDTKDPYLVHLGKCPHAYISDMALSKTVYYKGSLWASEIRDAKILLFQ